MDESMSVNARRIGSEMNAFVKQGLTEEMI